MRSLNRKTITAAGLTLALLAVVGWAAFQPAISSGASAQKDMGDLQVSDTTVDASAENAALTEAFAAREAAYSQQIEQLNQALLERESAYTNQIQALAGQVQSGQQQISTLMQQEQLLGQQVVQLQTLREQRLAEYQSQIQEARVQYEARFAQVNTQLSEAQARLAEANTLLGR